MSGKYLVTAEWLQAHRDHKSLVLLDASLKPASTIGGAAAEGVIPGARIFDLKHEFSSADSEYDHTLPVRGEFAGKMQWLGIDNESVIVVYDNQGIYSSPRAWFMIKAAGHDAVYLLDGGLPEWLACGYAVANEHATSWPTGNFVLRHQKSFFCDAAFVEDVYRDNAYSIIDARSEGRFQGIEPEPREGLKPGHIPNSYNLPFGRVLSGSKFAGIPEIENIFERIADRSAYLIFTCGSGVTSCIPAMAALMAGYIDVKIFDGSWSEWGNQSNNYPVCNSQSENGCNETVTAEAGS